MKQNNITSRTERTNEGYNITATDKNGLSSGSGPGLALAPSLLPDTEHSKTLFIVFLPSSFYWQLSMLCLRLVVFSLLRCHINRGTAFPTRLHVRPAKAQISLRIRAVYSGSSLSIRTRFGSLEGCAGWSESSLGAYAILLEILCPGWNFFKYCILMNQEGYNL